MSISKDLNLFQIVILGVFLFIGVIGVVFFATNKAGVGKNSYNVTIWGVLPKSAIDVALAPYRERGTEPKLTYVEYSEDGFDQSLLLAIAEGRGPDAIIFPNNMYYGQYNRLYTIPSESMSAKVFGETYIDTAQQFSTQSGVKALPLVVDPLVMFWNKDMFAAEGLLNPPKTWNELYAMTNKIARKQDNGVVDRAFVAFGEYGNVEYAKRILFTLLSQVGVQMGYYNPDYQSYTSGLLNGTPQASDKTRSVITYYTEFANPLKPSYSWNRSFISARDAFLSADLGLYFAPASEAEYLRTRNPNLNFGVSAVPQEYQNFKSVQGKTYSVGFLVSSKNLAASIGEITRYLTTPETNLSLANAVRMAPARRDVLANVKNAAADAELSVTYESAVYARDWLDPNPTATDAVLKTMIESITSGKQTLFESIQDASDRLDKLYGAQG